MTYVHAAVAVAYVCEDEEVECLEVWRVWRCGVCGGVPSSRQSASMCSHVGCEELLWMVTGEWGAGM